jgi:hypothetical protein
VTTSPSQQTTAAWPTTRFCLMWDAPLLRFERATAIRPAPCTARPAPGPLELRRSPHSGDRPVDNHVGRQSCVRRSRRGDYGRREAAAPRPQVSVAQHRAPLARAGAPNQTKFRPFLEPFSTTSGLPRQRCRGTARSSPTVATQLSTGSSSSTSQATNRRVIHSSSPKEESHEHLRGRPFR